jgi:hypothetical protein
MPSRCFLELSFPDQYINHSAWTKNSTNSSSRNGWLPFFDVESPIYSLLLQDWNSHVWLNTRSVIFHRTRSARKGLFKALTGSVRDSKSEEENDQMLHLATPLSRVKQDSFSQGVAGRWMRLPFHISRLAEMPFSKHGNEDQASSTPTSFNLQSLSILYLFCQIR